MRGLAACEVRLFSKDEDGSFETADETKHALNMLIIVVIVKGTMRICSFSNA